MVDDTLSAVRFLQPMLDEQLAREGDYSSFMIRAGLLRDIFTLLDDQSTRSAGSAEQAPASD